MKTVLVALLAIILAACTSNTEQQPDQSREPSEVGRPEGLSRPSEEATGRPSATRLANPLLGMWVAQGEENVTFQINQDSVYYPDQFQSYAYTLQGDSIRIQYEEDYAGRFAFALKDKDVLILSGEEGAHLYRRVQD
ncbi:hypothetical protein [Hymenobacter qilianensis]|uniref:Lipocalin family protein n=2 Tax=Hymenobacter qilianensis TaxID=1385715 RepID=A0A7H0H197_9BACT|nr:hypothetical protein [Hymenobacter qilianensis]QNP54313.1 hypothetical protein H9L05_21005 [Hymenobacter qilianensis]